MKGNEKKEELRRMKKLDCTTSKRKKQKKKFLGCSTPHLAHPAPLHAFRLGGPFPLRHPPLPSRPSRSLFCQPFTARGFVLSRVRRPDRGGRPSLSRPAHNTADPGCQPGKLHACFLLPVLYEEQGALYCEQVGLDLFE